MTNITFVNLGLTDFRKVWRFQKDLLARSKYYGGNDVVIFCEHKPVITLGRTASKENILCDSNQLKAKGIDFVGIDRGGDVTFHGPGQLVIYPIFDLKRRERDVRLFMGKLENVVIKALLSYNIKAYAKGRQRGVWVAEKKICSLGIGISGWVSYHGLAVNVNNDLSCFRYVKPCGLEGDVMTSLSEILDKREEVGKFREILLNSFIEIFN